MQEQKSIEQASNFSSLKNAIPFSVYKTSFKRQLAAVMEARRVLFKREICEGTNLLSDLIIFRSGNFDIVTECKAELVEEIAADAITFKKDKSGKTKMEMQDQDRVEKNFKNVTIQRF